MPEAQVTEVRCPDGCRLNVFSGIPPGSHHPSYLLLLPVFPSMTLSGTPIAKFWQSPSFPSSLQTAVSRIEALDGSVLKAGKLRMSAEIKQGSSGCPLLPACCLFPQASEQV